MGAGAAGDGVAVAVHIQRAAGRPATENQRVNAEVAALLEDRGQAGPLGAVGRVRYEQQRWPGGHLDGSVTGRHMQRHVAVGVDAAAVQDLLVEQVQRVGDAGDDGDHESTLARLHRRFTYPSQSS